MSLCCPVTRTPGTPCRMDGSLGGGPWGRAMSDFCPFTHGAFPRSWALHSSGNGEEEVSNLSGLLPEPAGAPLVPVGTAACLSSCDSSLQMAVVSPSSSLCLLCPGGSPVCSLPILAQVPRWCRRSVPGCLASQELGAEPPRAGPGPLCPAGAGAPGMVLAVTETARDAYLSLCTEVAQGL